MSIADELNQQLQSHHPTAHAYLTELGKRLYFPRGIPVQAAQAKNARINATIGQITDGQGKPFPLPSMARHIKDLDDKQSFLYSSVGGESSLREAWGARIQGRGAVPMSRPAVTNGLTHGLSMLGSLFIDHTNTVWIPEPAWGNYRQLYGTRAGADLRGYPVLKDGAFTLDGLAQALQNPGPKPVVVLNFPGNPTGYTPTAGEFKELISMLRAHPGPLMIIVDDAYQGMVFEEGLMPRSPYYELADLPEDTHFVVKVDGATKELLFFGGRVGFLTFAAGDQASAALEEKIKGELRSTINVSPGLPQALVADSLAQSTLDHEIQQVLNVLKERYQVLKQALAEHDVPSLPFNSGCFALLPTDQSPETLRQTLLGEGIGVVSCSDHPAIRIAYCSVAKEQIPDLVAGLAPHLRG